MFYRHNLFPVFSYLLLQACLWLGGIEAHSQPGKYTLTPNLSHTRPEYNKLIPQKIDAPKKFQNSFDTSLTLNASTCYTPHLFYIGGLKNPTGLEFDDKEVLHVIDFDSNGAIYALPATKLIYDDYENFADTLIKVVDSVYAHSFKFFGGNIYVAERHRIIKCSDINRDGFFETKEVLVDSLIEFDTLSGPFNRSLVIDTVKLKMYVAVSASCNVCREESTGQIIEYNLNGGDKRIVATGIRKVLAMEAKYTGWTKTQLWTANQGSTGQEDTIPPDWIDNVLNRDSSYYGFPFAYGYQNWFNFDSLPEYAALKPITAKDSARVAKMHHPAGLLPAYSYATDIAIAQVIDLDESGELIMTLGGDTQVQMNRGYKVIVVSVENQDVYYYKDLITGFITDTLKGTHWGRPAGIARRDKWLMTSDIFISSNSGVRGILKLNGRCPVLGLSENPKYYFQVYPNPILDYLRFEPALPKEAMVHLTDASGKKVWSMHTQREINEIQLPELAQGIYILQVESKQGSFHKILVKTNE